MKKYFALLFVLAAILALTAFAAPSAQAGTGPHCTSDPAEGAIGTVFTIECTGFTPNTHLWAYLVQPDGAAESCMGMRSSKSPNASNPCEFKTDETGSVSAWFDSNWNQWEKPALGTWTLVLQQLGPGFSIVGQAEASFRITGGTEGVSGAKIWTGAASYNKLDEFTIYGSGFAPNEIVTLWLEFPNGDCSTFTEHLPPYFNIPTISGSSVWSMWDVKADKNGEFSTGDSFQSWFCEGSYRFVARGNTSGNGGETRATFVGNAVETNAMLWADKSAVAAMGETITFSGSGYAADESVTCWLSNPQNSALQIYHEPEIKTNGSGQFSFSTWTGSFLPHPGWLYFSEGPLGEYAMTCRGNQSGAVGLTRFVVTGGNLLDP